MRTAGKSANTASISKPPENLILKMITTPIEISEAKNRLPIPKLWTILNLNGDPPPHDGVCRSPFRDDSTPSFSIYANGTRFKDHGTGEGGDAIAFYAIARGIDNREAFQEFLQLADQTA